MEITILKGVDKLGKTAYSMKDNMVARLKTPVLEDGTDLWKTYLDSKDVNSYGSKNDDGRRRFKMDHAFDLDKIINASLANGAVPSSIGDYSASTGTEFIILDDNHSIRADKYVSIVDKLDKDDYSIDDLQDCIFKINADLSTDQVIKYDRSKFDTSEKLNELTWEDIEYVHDGWLGHAVGKNNASEEEYLEAAKLLAKYALKAEKKDCFDGMGFCVNTGEDFVVRSWRVGDSDFGSITYSRGYFGSGGRFLRVLDKVGEAGRTKNQL